MSRKNLSTKKFEFVEINEEQVKIEKMGMIKYAQMTESATELFEEIMKLEFSDMSDTEFLALIPTIISKNLIQVLKLIHVATNIPLEDIEQNIGLDDCLNILGAIIRVNNLQMVLGEVKKLITMRR